MYAVIQAQPTWSHPAAARCIAEIGHPIGIFELLHVAILVQRSSPWHAIHAVHVFCARPDQSGALAESRGSRDHSAGCGVLFDREVLNAPSRIVRVLVNEAGRLVVGRQAVARAGAPPSGQRRGHSSASPSEKFSPPRVMKSVPTVF